MKGQQWKTLNLKPYIPNNEKKGRGHVVIDGALVPGEGGISSSGELEIFFRRSFLHDGAKINCCIQHLTNGQMAMPWAGPFIAFKHADALGLYGAAMGEDMPVLIQYFRTGITGPGTALKEARKQAQRAWWSQ